MGSLRKIRCLGLPVVLAVVLAASAAAQEADLPPAGFGTLGQDDIGVRLRTTDVAISLIPLDEAVVRLLAPDTYGSMRRLLDSKATEIADAARLNGISDPSVFLVSFFGIQTRTRIDAEALTITGQSRLYRPRAFVPVSPSFSDRQVNQRETATAVYLYETGLRLTEPFTVAYDGVSSGDWARILRTLDRERAAVMARAAAAMRDTTVTTRIPTQTLNKPTR